MGNPDTAAARTLFQTKVAPGAADAIRKDKELLDATREIVFSTDTLITNGQPAPLVLHLTRLKAQVAKVEASLAALDASIAAVQQFAKAHAAALNDLPEVEKLGAELADQRRRAAARIPALKAAQDKAETALASLADSRTALNAAWAAIERDARSAHQEVLATAKTMYGHRDKANAAARSRDRKALADVKGAAELVPNPFLSDWPQSMKRQLADIARRYEKKSGVKDANLLAQLKKDRQELQAVLDRIALNAELIESLRQEIHGVQPAAPDMARVLKIVGAPSSSAARVRKLLDAGGSVLARGLEDLVKDLGLKAPAKQILGELRKEGYAD